jgi:N-formylglutamate deformylase
MGYAVSRNKPYAGGFITEHYGNPAAGLHAIQLEFNRALYMDERRFERSATFDRLAADLETLADRLAAIPPQELRPYRAAAE